MKKLLSVCCVLAIVAAFTFGIINAFANTSGSTPFDLSTTPTASSFPVLVNSSGVVTYPTNITPNVGLFLKTNAVAAWPTAAKTPGGCFFGMSNHVVYLLTSTPGSTAWAATNKIAP